MPVPRVIPAPRWPRSRKTRAPAYMMPLSVGAVGLLLLQSLTVQSITQLEVLQVSAMERIGREEDLLASAAHQLLASLNGSQACLLGLPLDRWETEGGACASSVDLANLRELEIWEVPVRLLRWQPSADGTAAELELELAADSSRAARRGRFGVRLSGAPLQAVDPRPHALGGPQP